MQTDTTAHNSSDRPTLFDDRYGPGAYERLLQLLAQPCVTFAAIAGEFGVTRERARQWQLRFLPDAPRGRERKRLCVLQGARRRLLADPVFKAFYVRARAAFGSDEVLLIRSRTGFRRRTARLGGHLVSIRKARQRSREGAAPVHVLTPIRRPSEFVFYQLAGGDFLFVPGDALPDTGTTFLDAPGSKYQRYRNTFAAAVRQAADVN